MTDKINRFSFKKEIKKYGDSFVIKFSAEEQRVYGIEEGMICDFSDVVFIRKRVSQKRRDSVLLDSEPSNKQKSNKIITKKDYTSWRE